jgi:hypothetical protein
MNSLQQPRAEPLAGDRSADDLDGLLRVFFRTQMPEPWPRLAPPVTLPLPGQRRRSLFRSRFVLAASLLILLLSQLFLASMFSGYPGRDASDGRYEATNRPAAHKKGR